jgi:hypothetical protein
MSKNSLTQKTLALLLSGKSRVAKKFAGKHVLVVGKEVVPLKKGENGWKDFVRLEKKYGHSPVVVFVPRPDISYILFN